MIIKQKVKEVWQYAKFLLNRLRTSKRMKSKIFVIGFNKTGTTSVYQAMKEFDVIVGNQRKAELLVSDCIEENYSSLFAYCKSAEAFQDIPFSKPGIFKLLDEKFPNSKFILTVRDSPEQWFNSICRFHTKLFSQKDDLPTLDDLQNAEYVHKGWTYLSHTWTYGERLYDFDHYTKIYSNHLEEVKNYFAKRESDLLVINVAEPESYKKLCAFIEQKPLRDTFEWKNKTEEIRK